MKLRSDNERGRGKGKWPNEGDDRCGTIMEESLVISSRSDYDPGEESNVESEGNVSLEEQNIRDFEKGECSRSSGEEEDDEEGVVEERRAQFGKRKRIDLTEGRRWRRKAAGDGGWGSE